jgi:hypothetical protein
MNRNRVRWTFTGIVLAFAGATNAADIYVATTGINGNSGTSAASPLSSIAAAANIAKPGDTIWLSPGHYQESVVPPRSGAAGRPITFKKFGQGSAVIVAPSAGTNKTAIYINGVTDIVIDGIDANGGNPGPAAAFNTFVTVNNSSRITIQNGTYVNANGWDGIGVPGSSYVTIEDNQIDMVGQFLTAPTAPSHGGGLGEAVDVYTGNPTYVLVQRNHITHSGHDLLTVGGQFNIAQDNYLDNNWSDVQGSPAGYRNAVVFGSNNVFQRNYLTHSGPGPASYPFPVVLRVEGSNNIVRQNVLAYGYYQAFQSQAASWTPNGSGDHIYNNTAYNMGAGAWSENIYAGYMRGNDVFENNLIVDSRINPPPQNASDNDIIFWVKVEGLAPTGGSVVINNLIVPAGGKPPIIYSDVIGGSVPFNDPGHALSAFVFGNLIGAPQFASTPVTAAATAPLAVARYALSLGSAGVGQGAFLTKTTAAGNSVSLPVSDPLFFSDGLGIVPGDMVKLQGASQAVQVTHVNYAAKTLTLAQSVAFRAGQGVALNYQGQSPNIGAVEANAGVGPLPPQDLQVQTSQ